MHVIDALQYANWSRAVFEQMREGGVDAVHATVAYHENFRDMTRNLQAWNRRFEEHGDLIFAGRCAADIRRAKSEGKTAVFFGLQNPSPIEGDWGLIEICHTLGVRFMQMSYNTQSLLAAGCFETADGGITRFGKQAVREMNRAGMVIDLSHAGEKSALQTIEASARPVAVTHANPAAWHETPRNVGDKILRALAQSGGMLGFSLYPHHLKNGARCTLADFCAMVARAAEKYGVEHLGIGSDLCQDQPDSVVDWMRRGYWQKEKEGGDASFPPQPSWFRDNRDFPAIAAGLRAAGFNHDETAGIMGDNWLRFFDHAFAPSRA